MSTPLEIDIALWYHTRAIDYGAGTNFNAPAVQEILNRFVDAGLLKRHEPSPNMPRHYYGTEGLTVYVDALCSLPWPEQRWIMPGATVNQRDTLPTGRPERGDHDPR